MRISDWSSDVCSSDLQMIEAEYGLQIALPQVGPVMEALQYPGRLSQGISRRRPAKRHWLHHLDSAIAAEHLLSARSLGHPLLLSLVLSRRGRTQSGHVEMYAAHRRRMMEADHAPAGGGIQDRKGK